MAHGGYLPNPTIHGDEVVFVCEDDLWLVGAAGGRAYRMTAGVAEAGTPRFSPDGTLLAFSGQEEGPADVYVMPAGGGEARRLTYHGGRTIVAGFDPSGAVVYATTHGQPTRGRQLHTVSPEGGLPRRMPVGAAGPGGCRAGRPPRSRTGRTAGWSSAGTRTPTRRGGSGTGAGRRATCGST